ncbi:DUF1688 family protein [Pseudoxanthobacter sp. M-2]|uniref:DUF1688 family protein n=1 Tax=Pseudoxanthobacter sp. M-2 TaxID=3078754 RepID=UPI0038FBE51D
MSLQGSDRNPDPHPDEALARSLLSAHAVRERANMILAATLDGNVAELSVDLDRLENAADLVAETTRAAYPDLVVPPHSRFRHFSAGGHDRFGAIAAARGWTDPRGAARAAADLAIVSVLLDAGAGPDWVYREGLTGEAYSRSEGLAVASVAMFVSGLFSAVPADPLRADAISLATLATEELSAGFKVKPGNPLAGLDGRADLMRRLGIACADRDDVFAMEDEPRPGGIVDALVARAEGGQLPAAEILALVLDALGPIWPSRLVLAEVPLGDTWRHPAINTDDITTGLVPLHKLSQWLSYSLLEPLGWAGVEVVELDGLTGLAEYRNGGLFLDTGVIRLTDPADAERTHAVGSSLIVGWRALTVALIDRLAPLVRTRLGLDAESLPLAAVLEGGTWAAGRRIARTLRHDGGPPLKIESDGTVF